MGALVQAAWEFVFQLLLEFRIVRWVFSLGLLAVVWLSGSLFTAGGIFVAALALLLLGVTEFFARRRAP